MSLSTDRRKKWRLNAYDRWSRFAVKQIRYEYWTQDVWSVMLETVTDSCSTDLLANLTHPSASNMMELLERNYAPVTMTRKGESQIAQTVTQFLSLSDNKFLPADQYLQEFVLLLRAYIYAMLVKTTSRCSMVELAKHQASNAHQFDRVLEVGAAECLHFGCSSYKITRRRAIAACVKLVKPASRMQPKVHELMSWSQMECVRLANSILHLMLFQDNINRLRKVGVLLFVSVMEGENPETAHDNMRRARILLP